MLFCPSASVLTASNQVNASSATPLREPDIDCCAAVDGAFSEVGADGAEGVEDGLGAG